MTLKQRMTLEQMLLDVQELARLYEYMGYELDALERASLEEKERHRARSKAIASDGKSARLISNSGGRSSAMMLYILKEQGLRPHDRVVFANTGKEQPGTLNFLKEQGDRWGVKIHWVEYLPTKPWYKVVTYDTASLNGEPFASMIAKHHYVPNVFKRICTTQLKILPMKRFMVAEGFRQWENLVGLRKDEAHRQKPGAVEKQRWSNVYPLNDAGIRVDDVKLFWDRQPFDLLIDKHLGNCDLCPLKGIGVRLNILKQHREKALWWAEQERLTGYTFQKGLSIEMLAMRAEASKKQFDLFEEDTNTLNCHCHD